jgi:hypothetical protein
MLINGRGKGTMQMMKWISIIGLLCLFPLMLTCGGGGGGGGSNGGGGGGGPEASATIGPSGGTVEVTNTASPLYGVKIDIPPNALSQDTVITISKVEIEAQGIAVRIGPSGTIFKTPATVTIPYKDETDEEFLVVFTAEDGETFWTLLSDYLVDPLSNKVSFNLSHLTQYLVGIIDEPPQIKIFFKGGSKNLDEAQNETAKATIREVIMNGPWKEYYDCVGVTVTEVASESEATIIINWEELPLDEKGKPPNAQARGIITYCDAKGCHETIKEIILNEIEFHITLDEDILPSQIDLYSVIAHEMSHVLGMDYDWDLNDPTNAITDGGLIHEEMARVLQPIDRTRIKKRHPECEDCINIAGTWSGTVNDGAAAMSITLNLTQDNCNISGTMTSPESCPALCGYATGEIKGTVSKNIFSFDIPQDPTVDCETCQFICFGRDYGSLTVNNEKMTGTAQTEDCEMQEYYPVTIDLTRQNAGTISRQSIGKGKTNKSGLFPKNLGGPLEKGK